MSLNVDVTDYGADPTGATDSTSEIQDAINAVGTAGGGVVTFSAGDEFLLESRTSSGSDWYWCLDASWDNLTLNIEGKIICNPTAGAANTFHLSGAAKKARAISGSINDWPEYWLWEYGGVQYTTQYNLDPAGTFAEDSYEVVLETPAEDVNFSVGDWIGIRTGNLVGDYGLPDGELQQVASVNGGTLTLEDPLKTDYAQEYYIAGTSGLTSTSVTANPAPYAAAVATDRLLYNVAIKGGGTIEQQTQAHVVIGGQALYLSIENLTASCNGYGLSSFGRSRHLSISDVVVDIYDAIYAWWISADSTCTDYEWTNLTMTADYPTAVHINEGTGRVHLDNVRVYTPSVSGNRLLVGIGARGYDVDIENCYFEGGGETVQIYVDTDYTGAGELSGHIHQTQFSNTSGGLPFAMGSGNWPRWIFEAYIPPTGFGLPPVSTLAAAHGAGRPRRGFCAAPT